MMRNQFKAGFLLPAGILRGIAISAALLCFAAVLLSGTVLASERPALKLSSNPRQGTVLTGMAPAGTRSITMDGRVIAVAADGRFLIGFDRDARSEAVLMLTGQDGTQSRFTLAVAPGSWRIERVNAPMRGGAASDEDYQRRRAGELARINAARATSTGATGWRQAFIWPVKARISGVFGSQRIYQGVPGSYHSGVDLAGGAGTIYAAPADGVVTLAASEPFTLEGRLLMIDHGMGLSSAFLHSQTLLVKEGDNVRQGQPIGTIGATGRASGPHLHWGMKWGSARIDPVTLVPPIR
jgi:hypothetical protein